MDIEMALALAKGAAKDVDEAEQLISALMVVWKIPGSYVGRADARAIFDDCGLNDLFDVEDLWASVFWRKQLQAVMQQVVQVMAEDTIRDAVAAHGRMVDKVFGSES